MLSRAIVAVCLAAVAQLSACASAGEKSAESKSTASATTAKAADDWQLEGWRVIACCCAAPCPCRINKKPMNCHGCDHSDVVHVDKGTFGGTKMDGVTWVVVGRGFGEDIEGNWAKAYVDDDATDAQVKAVGDLLSGTVEGWGARAPYLAGKFLGVEEKPMTVRVSADGRQYTTSIPGVLEVDVRAIVNPGRKEPVVSTGVLDSFGDRFVHADTLVHRYDDAAISKKWDLTGKQANYAEFVLSPSRIAEGHYGWGCWSAHTSFGDDEPYGEEQVGHAHGEKKE